MRFDDMIATVLERPSERVDQRVAQWRQLVDLLAQGRDGGATEQVDRAYEFLRRHRDEVPLEIRTRTAVALTGLPIDARMIALFGEDHPSVSSAMLRGAKLDAGAWIEVLPALTPTGRAILRHRRDLPTDVVQALTTFGSTDFVIEGTAAPEAAPEAIAAEVPAARIGEGPSQIRELVERIEAFQKHREDTKTEPPLTRIEEFRWETGVEGVILWIDGAPRGPLVGQSIAAIAQRGQFGVDGQAVGAFHKRAPFRDARLTVAGKGAAAGGWRISGVPYFDMHRGTFRGYRGTARRPRFDEVAAVQMAAEPADGLFGTNLAPDSLRQLMHELRTPLNAIIGFAEMIEGQYLGPAGGAYRGRAADIVGQAQRLLGAVDDLDAAARIETSLPELDSNAVDAGALMMRLHQACVQEAEAQGVEIGLHVAADLPLIAVEASAAERMFSRLIAATIGLAGPGDTIDATMRRGLPSDAVVELAISRPRSIAGLEEPQLLHPGYSPEGDWPAAPALGLGFALRLVRKLAEAVGGGLTIFDDSFVLTLPAAGIARREDEESA